MKKDIDKQSVNEVLTLSKKLLKLIYIVMVVGIVFLVTLLVKEWGILTFILTILKVATPFFIGFVIAWLFNPAVTKLEKNGVKRGLGSILVYLIFISLLILFFYMLVPTIYTQLNDLIASIPSILEHFKNFIGNVFVSVDGLDLSSIQNNLFNSITNMINNVTTNLPEFILNSVSSIFSGIGTIMIGLVIGLYMLFDFNNIDSYLIRLIPDKYESEVKDLLDQIGTEVRKYVNGILLVASMVFVCDAVGFAILGLKAPLLFGLLCGITDLIPFIGPYIGGIAAVIVGFSQSTFIGIMTIVIVVIVQLVENYILQPVVMSKTMKLHPVTIIIGLLIFGHFFGIVGMVLATPCIALGKVIYRFFAKKYKWFM